MYQHLRQCFTCYPSTSNFVKNALLHVIFSTFFLVFGYPNDCLSCLILGTFRSEDEDDYEYEFSILSMRIRFGGRHFSKCTCSDQKTRTLSRPRSPI